MMRQYRDAKRECPDCVLFFRLGDFYEMFSDDAVEVSTLLNLTLTKRVDQPMCGVPYHAARSYIARLLKYGKKVAICEQVSVPGVGKGLVDRRIVEVVTPGTAVEEDYLDAGSFNYIAALGRSGATLSFAYLDVSTGDFRATAFPLTELRERIRKELGRLQPRELVIQESLLEEQRDLAEAFAERPAMVLDRFPDWSFDQQASLDRLRRQFGTANLKGFGFADGSAELLAAGVLLNYADEALKSALPHVSALSAYGDDDYVGIDDATRRNLELTANLQDGSSRFTVFEVLDETRTAMGKRLLKSRLHHPLRSVAAVERRLDAVEALYRDQATLSALRDALSRVLDLERLTARVATDRAHARDLLGIRDSLAAYRRSVSLAADIVDGASEDVGLTGAAEDDLEALEALRSLLERGIDDDASILLSEGGMIRDGYDAELDRLKKLKADGRSVLEAYLQEEREATGIQNLKIKYNRLIGYYLEVTKANLNAVPERFIRRQGVANGERFTTDRLVDLETNLNSASERIVELERRLFLELRERAKERIPQLLAAARRAAALDVAQALARSATVRGWVRPRLRDDRRLSIREGRHPVVEANLPRGEFVPNDLDLDAAAVSFALITGPNMAGKSTYLRQSAILVLLAQIGSFVPARDAEIGIVDRIFCRVGASDNLARGESTFLVEMNETANILRNASGRSLVIMDEVGRGTGTADGLSIAWAVCEELLDGIGCRTLFATHYHELSRMVHPRLVNRCLDVLEREGEIVFLKKVKDGASAESYGLHVARIAGLPSQVVARARTILDGFRLSEAELHRSVDAALVGSSGAAPAAPLAADDAQGDVRGSGPVPSGVSAGAGPANRPHSSAQASLFAEEELLAEELRSLDLDRTTPMEALQLLAAWRRRLQGPDSRRSAKES